LMLSTCVGFFVIIGDLAPPIVSKILDIPNVPSLRVSILVLTAFGVALPLGFLRKLSSLTSVSSLSFGFYFSLVLFLFLQALPSLFSGQWSSGPHKLYYWRPAGILKCFPIFGLAFACQTQLFPIYDTMSDPSLKRMLNVIDSAINMVGLIYLSVGFFGIIAFYDRDVVGDVLLSFRPSIAGEAIKLGFVLSVAVSFPLVIFPCRLSINSLLWPPPKKGLGEALNSDGVPDAGAGYIPPIRFKSITLGIVIITLIVGINVPGIESILGLVGSTVGVIISFVFPSSLFLYVSSLSHGEYREKFVSKVLLGVGLFIMLSSTYMNLTETKIKPLPVAPTIPPPAGGGGGGGGGGVNSERALPPKPASEIPAVDANEVRREPPVPNEPVDVVVKPVPNEPVDVVVKKKDEDNGEEKKQIVDVKLSPAAEGKPAGVEKEDYDNLQKKLDAAEEKHDVLLKQLEKQQEQQKIIMDQQNQIIEQLKAKPEAAPGGVGGAGEAAAGGGAAGVAVAIKPAAAVGDPPAVAKKLEITKKEIADADKILSRVAEEAKVVETDVEETAKKAAAKKKIVVDKNAAADVTEDKLAAAKKTEDKAAAEAQSALAAAEGAKKKLHEAEMARKVEEAAKYMAEEEEKKRKAAVAAVEEEEAKQRRIKAAAAAVVEEAKRKTELEAKLKAAEAAESMAKKVEEAAQYIAQQQAKKKAAEEEEKKKKAEEEAKLAAEEAKKKEEEAHKAAELAVLKVLEAKKAASDAQVKNAALKEATVLPGGGGSDNVVAAAAAKKVAAVESAPEVVAAAVAALEDPVKKDKSVPVASEAVVGGVVDAAGGAAAVAETAARGSDEKEDLKKKLETHEKLIVQMHQKIQDFEKEKAHEGGKEAAAAAAVETDAKKEDKSAGNGNPKPLGLKASDGGKAAEPAVAMAGAAAGAAAGAEKVGEKKVEVEQEEDL